jgi:hypothetical protein
MFKAKVCKQIKRFDIDMTIYDIDMGFHID